MENKEDWEELKRWENERKNQEISKYGLNFSNINTKKEQKKVKKIVNLLYSFNMSTIAVIIILIIIIIGILITYYENITFMMSNTSVEKSMMQKYNLNVTIFSKIKDPNKDYMLFKMNTDNSENIEFTVIKKNGKLMDDYIARRHQYYFELWNSSNKIKTNKIKINESMKNELLSYEMYIENIKDIEYFEEAVKECIEFIRFCVSNFMEEWDIHIYINNKKIYLFRNINTKMEDYEIIKKLKNQYFIEY